MNILPRFAKKELLEAHRLKSSLSKINIDFDHCSEFTVEEVVKIVEIAFPEKAEKSHRKTTSYGFKHVMERLSEMFNKSGIHKYCSNRTFIEAMVKAGFKAEKEIPGSPNYFFNVEKSHAKNLWFLLSYNIMLDEIAIESRKKIAITALNDEHY